MHTNSTASVSPAGGAPVPTGLRMLRVPEVSARTGLSIATLHRMRTKGLFPEPVRLSEHTVAWPEHELDAWIAARITERDKPAA